MVRSDAVTVEQYLTELDPERRQEVSAVRDVVLANLPEGYQESMNWGMISYEIPLERYPDTYNRQPLVYAALASQKNYMSLYLMGLYGDPEQEQSFEQRYRATGKRYDVGKSCVRFRRLDDLPLDLIGEVIASTSVDDHIAHYEAAR
jgi:uncharacterized protein YdhG (YjbR/CyaY superfamily)